MPTEPIFGVQTHMAQGWSPAVLDQAAAAGLGLVRVRDEAYWAGVEPSKGSWDWHQTDAMMAKLAALGMRIILTVNWSNPAYDGDQAADPGSIKLPDSDAERAAFAAYVLALVGRYHTLYPGVIEAVEVWNEVNGSWGGGYAPDAVVIPYCRLLKAVQKALRADKAFDGIKVLGGACVLVPFGLIKDMQFVGALSYMDGFVVHPYAAAEVVLRQAARLKSFSLGKAIYATEFGGVSDPAEAARLIAVAKAAGFVRASWYPLQSYGGFDSGLLNQSGTLSSVGAVWRYLATALSDADYLGRVSGRPRTHILRYRTRTGEVMAVCWTERGEALATVTGAHRCFYIHGGERTAEASYTLGRVPLVIVGDVTIRETLSGEVVLADMARDFSMTQGKGGWSYLGGDDNVATPLWPDRDQWEDFWTEPAAGWSRIGPEQVHPSNKGGRPFAVLRRWTVPAGVTRIVIDAQISHGQASGDGVAIAIRHNGSDLVVWPALKNRTVAWQGTATVAAGDRIDFVTGPGAAGETSYDATGWQATIAKV